MKNKKKANKNKNNINRFILIFIMMLCLIVSMITYWIYAYHHKYGKTYFDDKVISYKLSDYIEVNGNIIYLNNINDEINIKFVNSQREILNNNNIVDMTITKGIYRNILSLKISYTVDNNLTTYEKIIALNIDLENKKQLTQEDMLKKVNISYKDIATDIFNEYIKLSDSKVVTDSITDKKLTSSEFNKDSEKYIIRIREKLPDIMNVYIEDGEVYYFVKLSEINKVCYYTDEKLININKKIGKI
ncbi:MAG: hypothetical protein IJZ46_01990 [Bacilli bacterium]|nr:hypothetical protein [Bacilli bacterium]